MARNTVLAKRKARRAIKQKQKQKQTVIVNIGALTRPRRRAAARPPVVVRQAPSGAGLRQTAAPVVAPLVNAGFADHYARVNAMALDDFRRGIAAAARETPVQHEAEERELARGGQLSRLVAEADDLRIQNAAVEARASGLESEILSQKATLEDHYRGMLDDQRRRHVRAIEEASSTVQKLVLEKNAKDPKTIANLVGASDRLRAERDKQGSRTLSLSKHRSSTGRSRRVERIDVSEAEDGAGESEAKSSEASHVEQEIPMAEIPSSRAQRANARAQDANDAMRFLTSGGSPFDLNVTTLRLVAQGLNIRGRTAMSREELVPAVQQALDRKGGK